MSKRTTHRYLQLIGTLLAAGALCAACASGLTGCSSGVSSTSSDKNDTTTLAQASSKLNDRTGAYTPDVSGTTSIPYTVHLEESDDEGEEAGSEEYTVDVSIDPYLYLWSAKGMIVDIDYTTDLAVVRLSVYNAGHFASQDVLITYADYLSVSEYDLKIGSNISFQYLLTKPMHVPLQAYNVALA